MKASDFFSSITLGGLAKGSQKLASGPLTTNIIEDVYGSPEKFLEQYETFQKKYVNLLKSGQIDPAKIGRVNIDTLIAGGKIDLSILSEDVARTMQREYTDSILKLPALFQKAGLPDTQLISSNLYRDSMRYTLQKREAGAAMHPAEVLLNRTILNINRRVAGVDAFNPGVSNLIGTSSLKQGVNPIDLSGKRVFTFDVETTGVFQGSQVRSMAIAETIDDRVSLLDDFNLTFKNSQLSGVMIGGRETMNDFLARSAGSSKLVGDSRGGQAFLDQSEKFIRKLLEADHVAGHNVMFDIQALTNTIQQQSGFNNHKGVQEALSLFHERMASNENFIIDTLEQSRAYLSNQISTKIEAAGTIDDATRLKMFKQLTYSDEFLARAKIGKGAASASVEAIAMNTNLLDLIEKEAIGGSDQATKLIQELYQGTHIADTDAVLQGYVGKYINKGIANRSDPFSLKVVTRSERAGFSELVRGAQSKIFRSAAMTPTTNIADMTHLSETVRGFIEGEGIRGVQVTSSARELADAGLIKSIPTGISDNVMGVMGFDERTGKGIIQLADQEPIYVDSAAANKYVGQILRESLDPTFEKSVNLVRAGETVSIGRVNTSAQKILDLGITYMQASQIDEVTSAARATSTLRPLIDGTKAIDENRLLNSVGKTYELLSRGAPLFEGMKGKASFSPGLAGATADTAARLAEASLDIGSPHKILSNQSRMFSAIVSQSTINNLSAARERAIEMSADANFDAATARRFADEAEYLRYSKIQHMLPEYGVSHFITQKEMRLVNVSSVGATEEIIPSRLFVPQQILEAALGDDIVRQGNFSLSVARVSKKDQLNVFWRVGKEEGSKTSKEIAESLYDFVMSKKEINNVNKATQTQLRQTVDQTRINLEALRMHGDGVSRDEIVDLLAKQIDEGGIGTAYASEESTQAFIKSARRAGIPYDNEKAMLDAYRASMVRTTGDYQTLVLSSFEDETVLRASKEARDDMVQATAKLRNGALGEVSDAITGTSQTTQAILKLRQKRKMIGMKSSDLLETFIKQKSNLRNAAIGAAIAGVGYYAYRRGRQNDIYDETLERQPTESYSGNILSDTPKAQKMNSFRRDPLVTAGVVGNLDRNKIGHYRMGNDKYNHLYSGA